MRACYARRESLTGRVSGARFAGVTVHVVPRRQTLVTQTIAVLERGLREGRWTGTLPGQHTLCDQLVISRTTLRAALQVLARRNLIHLRQGTPTAIRRRPKTAHSAQRIDDVIVLLPERLWQLRPSVGRWVGELRPLLQRSGLELILSEDGLFYRPQPERRLEQLVQRHPHSGWVLFTSTLAMQSWFAARGLPVVLVGSVFSGVDVPSIEYDHAAISQHAAAQFIRAGHRRTAILLQHTGSAADATTCTAFAGALPPGSPAPLVLEHSGELAEIRSLLHRLARLGQRPTALFVTKSHAIPAVLTILPRLGLQVPGDLSVICREDDPFLEYLDPAVARYASDSSAIAHKLAFALARIVAGEKILPKHQLLMPRFVPGESIAVPRSR